MDNDNVVKAVFNKLGSEYKYVRHLGGGEFSNVYLVKHIATGKERALKILDYHFLLQRFKKQNLSDTKNRFDEVKRRFIGEARLYGKMKHPNIVRIHETGVFVAPDEEIEIPYFLMNYVKGSTLAEVIKKKAPLPLSSVQQISRNVLGALREMHGNNVVHRDIKASNIMIEEATNKAVIIDFGIAKDIVSGTKLTTTGTLLGSPAYMAPELFKERYTVGPGLDIYSFGVVLFEMLTGETPFSGNNFIEVMNAHKQKPVPDASVRNPSLPPGANFILAKAMAKEPGARYKNADDFLNALLQIHDVKKPARFNWRLYGTASLMLLAILAVLWFVVIKPSEPEKKPPPETTQAPVAEQKKPEPVQAGPQTPENQTGQPTDQKPAAQDRTEEPPPPDPLEEMTRAYRQLEKSLEGSAADSRKIALCRRFIGSYKAIPGREESSSMVTAIKERLQQLETAETLRISGENYNNIIRDFNGFLANENFSEAENTLVKAEAEQAANKEEISQLRTGLEQKKQDYENRHGDGRFQLIKDSLTLAKYLEFKRTYPQSKHLEEIKQGLKSADPQLPPESYWEKQIRKNARGYYEFTFGEEFNGHHMIYIPSRHFWIDKYEVSNGQYRRFIKARAASSPAVNGQKFIHSGENYPAVVRYGDAEAYCGQYGFRLPRLDEWEYVAGKGNRIYPWGDDAPDGGGLWRANFDTLTDAGEKDGFEGTAPVNSFKNFPSPFGALNMAGNVWEWGRDKILKGGSFFSSGEDLKININRVGSDKDKEGFRCIKYEPGEK